LPSQFPYPVDPCQQSVIQMILTFPDTFVAGYV
jgi:hypothetical protein